MSEQERHDGKVYLRRLIAGVALACAFSAYGLMMAEYVPCPWLVVVPASVGAAAAVSLEALRRKI